MHTTCRIHMWLNSVGFIFSVNFRTYRIWSAVTFRTVLVPTFLRFFFIAIWLLSNINSPRRYCRFSLYYIGDITVVVTWMIIASTWKYSKSMANIWAFFTTIKLLNKRQIFLLAILLARKISMDEIEWDCCLNRIKYLKIS